MTNIASEPVTHLDDLQEGSMKMVKVDGQRICVVRTASGVHAIDNACPHEGYGMTQGDLDGDVVTCAWHNWKFRVTDGVCILGEEDIQTHGVDIDPDGGVSVTVRRPDPAEQRPKLVSSLRRGIERDYRGQIARDTIRLLKASTDPGELIWDAVAYGAPRAEFGWGHAIASATDCLSMVDLYEGDHRALPIVQGIAGIAEVERDRPVRELPAPADGGDAREPAFRAAVEAEDVTAAQALVLAAIERGDRDLEPWFAGVVADHHLSYGHGAIYSQKAFELLDMIGWDRAHTVLPHLVPTLVYGTREDKLPYMRPFMKALAGVDLAELAEIEPSDGWSDGWTPESTGGSVGGSSNGGSSSGSSGGSSGGGSLVSALLGDVRTAPVDATVRALREGAGVDGVLDAVVAAVSERMLRYDTDGEFDFHDDFGWLDITHGLTYANAARWHHRRSVERGAGTRPEHVRLALFTAFQAQWTGRHEWHTRVGERAEIEPLSTDIAEYGDALQRDSMLDGTTAFIVHAHAVKTSRAASLEALRSDSTLPLDAAARFMAAPKLERFVAATVTRSIDFLNGRIQRD